MGDMVDTITNVALNVATGGLYSLVKAGVDTIETGNPSALLTQGLDLGMASTGNQIAVDLGGNQAGMAFNAAGAALGAAGAAGAFSGLPGFTPGGVAPLAAGAPSSGLTTLAETGPITATGPAPLAPGVMSSTSGAELAGATLGGPVGATAPLAPVAPTTGLIGAAEAASTAGTTGQAVTLSEAAQALQVAPSVEALSAPVKMALILGGAQMLTGTMGGLFEGLSAQKKMDLEKLINEQNQNQRQHLNKNQSYAPTLKFKKPTGMIYAGGT